MLLIFPLSARLISKKQAQCLNKFLPSALVLEAELIYLFYIWLVSLHQYKMQFVNIKNSYTKTNCYKNCIKPESINSGLQSLSTRAVAGASFLILWNVQRSRSTPGQCSWVVGAHTVQALQNHWISEWEGTHKGHWVQHLGPQSTAPKNQTACLRSLSKHLLNSNRIKTQRQMPLKLLLRTQKLF